MSNQARDFIITILVVTFVFAFDDKQATFNISYWLVNFLRVSLSVILVVFVHYSGHKWMANKYGLDITQRIWLVQRYWFKQRAQFKTATPLGPILAVIVSFLSNGKLFFIPVEAIDIHINEHKRMGRWRSKILDREIARVAFAGPAASILFAFILQLFNGSGMFDQIILISCLYAICHMIPLVQLDGSKIFFGSLYLYVFGLAFLLLSFLALMFIPAGISFIISAIGAIAVLVFFFVKVHLG